MSRLRAGLVLRAFGLALLQFLEVQIACLSGVDEHVVIEECSLHESIAGGPIVCGVEGGQREIGLSLPRAGVSLPSEIGFDGLSDLFGYLL